MGTSCCQPPRVPLQVCSADTGTVSELEVGYSPLGVILATLVESLHRVPPSATVS